MTSLPWLRFILLAVGIELVAVIGLVAIVAVAGPSEMAQAMIFAEATGAWYGPLAGAFLCFAGGYWLSKGAKPNHTLVGTILGATVAALDILLLVLAGEEFKALFVVSNILRVLAGAAGGLLASRAAKGAA